MSEPSGPVAEVRPMRPSDVRDAVATAARAFTVDPMFGWLGGDRLNTHRMLPGLLGGFVDDLVAHGRCWVAESSSDGVVGIAAWFDADGVHRDARRNLRLFVRGLRGAPLVRHPIAGLRLLDRLERIHPDHPHHYLALLTVDPEWQGRGLGGALLEPGLATADAEGLPCYLETQKEDNVGWYARHGFELVHVVRLGGAPPVWCLERPAR